MKAQNCFSSQVPVPALYLLSESYIFRCANETEKAIVQLLKQIGTWRQFYLVLERMDPTAQVVPAVDSVERIRSYLSGPQSWDFSNFIKHLASRTNEAEPGRPLSLPEWKPWQPMHANDKFETLLAARESWKRPNEGGRYV